MNTDIIRARLKSKETTLPIPGMDRRAVKFGVELSSRWDRFVAIVAERLTKPPDEAKRSWDDDDPMSLLEHLQEWQEKLLSSQGLDITQRLAVVPFRQGMELAARGENDGKFFAALSMEKATTRDPIALAAVEARTFSDVKAKDDAQMAVFRAMLLEGLARGDSPATVAKATAQRLKEKASEWQTLARTESARALNAGMFAEARRLGKEFVYVPEQPGACDHCKRLIIGRVFPADALFAASNAGRKQSDWVAALPTHPNCRCTAVAASEWTVEQALEKQSTIPAKGVKIEYKPPSQR